MICLPHAFKLIEKGADSGVFDRPLDADVRLEEQHPVLRLTGGRHVGDGCRAILGRVNFAAAPVKRRISMQRAAQIKQ
jgi:hypothetical protein